MRIPNICIFTAYTINIHSFLFTWIMYFFCYCIVVFHPSSLLPKAVQNFEKKAENEILFHRIISQAIFSFRLSKSSIFILRFFFPRNTDILILMKNTSLYTFRFRFDTFLFPLLHFFWQIFTCILWNEMNVSISFYSISLRSCPCLPT